MQNNFVVDVNSPHCKTLTERQIDFYVIFIHKVLNGTIDALDLSSRISLAVSPYFPRNLSIFQTKFPSTSYGPTGQGAIHNWQFVKYWYILWFFDPIYYSWIECFILYCSFNRVILIYIIYFGLMLYSNITIYNVLVSLKRRYSNK